MNIIETLFFRLMRHIIVKGYGANCETKDTDEYPQLIGKTSQRCASCRAKEVVEWIDDHIELLKT